jgi:hypothetical protein
LHGGAPCIARVEPATSSIIPKNQEAPAENSQRWPGGFSFTGDRYLGSRRPLSFSRPFGWKVREWRIG